VITIEHLDVQFDAEAQRDEAVFAQLFARHIAHLDQQRTHAANADERARCDRSTSLGSAGR